MICIVIQIVVFLLIFSASVASEGHDAKQEVWERRNNYITLTSVCLCVGFACGLYLVIGEDFYWWTPLLLAYLWGAVPSMCFMKAHGSGELEIKDFISALGRYLISIFIFPYKYVKAIMGDYNW